MELVNLLEVACRIKGLSWSVNRNDGKVVSSGPTSLLCIQSSTPSISCAFNLMYLIFQLLATLWLWKYLIDLLELSGRIVRIILTILQPRHNVIDVVYALIGSKYGCFGHLPKWMRHGGIDERKKKCWRISRCCKEKCWRRWGSFGSRTLEGQFTHRYAQNRNGRGVYWIR